MSPLMAFEIVLLHMQVRLFIDEKLNGQFNKRKFLVTIKILY